ncbi:MAG: ATP-binding protein [Parachlamydiaceae bacterium]|nr:ATP-binding protein [Parachlamydiaceae bacterium]
MLDELLKLSRHFLKIKNSSYRRYFIKTNPFKHRLSLVLGQRGIGKTTTLVQHLLDQVLQDIFDPSILYVQADHFQVGSASLYEIAEQFHFMGGKFLALDEIHKYPNWSQELKSLYDTFPDLTILASGSSALQMHQGSHDLARRAIKYQMFGLSFREYLELKFNVFLPVCTLADLLKNHVRRASSFIETIEAIGQKILPLFSHYLKCGYYPYFFELPNEEFYFLTLEQNLHTTIESDLVAIYPHLTGTSIKKIKQLLVFIAQAVPFTPKWNDIKNILDIGDIRTLKTYFQYLEDAYLIRSIGKENHKIAHLNSIEKVYLDNPNQMYALAIGECNKGTLRELFFLDMLSLNHQVALALKGDFLVDERYLFEVGGRNKNFKQIRDEQDAFLACDDIENGSGSKIPLWLFGFMY